MPRTKQCLYQAKKVVGAQRGHYTAREESDTKRLSRPADTQTLVRWIEQSQSADTPGEGGLENKQETAKK